jgi:excinuclease ABC subunit B
MINALQEENANKDFAKGSRKTALSQRDKKFELVSKYQPSGDQPRVIEGITNKILNQSKEQTILGVTGSGKTYMMASIINNIQKPTLVIAHNKTLAAQLAEEFKRFFPNNAVHYFVSYYDYYQPESYIPRSDTYIEKQTQINEEIERLRNATTQALLTRKDVLIVASVSCIYGLGDPEDFESLKLELEIGKSYKMDRIARRLIDLQFNRTNMDLSRSMFRIRGDILELVPSSEDFGYRFSFYGQEIEKIEKFELVTGHVIEEMDVYTVFPARQYVTTQEKIQNAISKIESDLDQRVNEFISQGMLLPAERLKQRTNNDIEMLQTLGYCSGIENYSIYFDGREDGSAPSTLIDYFPDDSLVFIDESHITLPQIGAMYSGDRSRKETLIEYGFRLPSALNNRPLKLPEFFEKINQAIYVSATPGDFELGTSDKIGKSKDAIKLPFRATEVSDIPVFEAIIRPTGLLDPEIILKPVDNQVDDVLEQVRQTVKKGQRVLITTLTKKFAEELDIYFKQINIKSAYIHSDVETLDRLDILSDLRRGKYDVLIGINLLREGLDLPEVSLVAIFDADKEGFLRSKTSLIQIIGRAARHSEGKVVMYAQTITNSMRQAIEETDRRREIQKQYNLDNNITPINTNRELESIADDVRKQVETDEKYGVAGAKFSPTGWKAVDEMPLESRYSRRGKERGKLNMMGKQVYDQFDNLKMQVYNEIKSQNLGIPELKKQMQIAVDEQNFETAAAIKDIMEEMAT